MIPVNDVDTRFIITYRNHQFNPFNTTSDMIDILDIAHALSYTCRWGGHSDVFYSVAEHSLHVSKICEPYGRDVALWGLLHDAAEAYLGDVPSPFKRDISNYREVEDGVLRVIIEKFGLEWPMPKPVKFADGLMLGTEAKLIMRDPEWARDANRIIDPAFRLQPWNTAPKAVELEFLDRFMELHDED